MSGAQIDADSETNPSGFYTTEATETRESLPEDQMRAEMEAVFESMTGPAAQEAEFKATPPMPRFESKSIDETFEKVASELERPIEDRRADAETQRIIDARRADAEKFGLTLAEREAMERNAQQAKVAAEWQPLTERIAKSAPDLPAVPLMEKLFSVAETYEADPKFALRWMAEQKGLRISFDDDAPQGMPIAQPHQNYRPGQNLRDRMAAQFATGAR